MPPIGAVPLKGLRQASISLLNSDQRTYQAPYLVSAPQLLGVEEDQSIKELPGGDVVYDKSATIKSAKATFRFSGFDLKLLSIIQGSRYQLTTDAGGKKTEVLDRRTSDSAPYLKLEGLTRYVGTERPDGDYHWLGYRGKLVGSPKIGYQTEEYATVELTFEFFERSDGAFYSMRLAESGSPLSEFSDVSAPVVGTTVPAEAATAVAASGTITVPFDKPILLMPSNWKLYKVVSPTNLVPQTITTTLSTDGKTVTVAYSGLAAAQAHRLSVDNVSDLSGNTLLSITRNFTTA